MSVSGRTSYESASTDRWAANARHGTRRYNRAHRGYRGAVVVIVLWLMAVMFILPGLYIGVRVSLPDPWGALAALIVVICAAHGLFSLLQYTMR